VPPFEAGTSPDLIEASGPVADTGSCGLGALLLAPANPLCEICISASAPLGCCEAASACSLDLTCPARVECGTLSGLGPRSCPAPEDLATAQFLQCLEQNCAIVCSDVVLELSADQ
jgi:hypothetical protein